MFFQSITILSIGLQLFLSSESLVDAKRLVVDCNTDYNYTDGSIFQSNLQTLLSSLQTTAINSGGFSNISIGDPTSSGRVSGVLMCYGDSTTDECEACINTTTTNMTTACPYSKKASAIYDRCYLRYSDENFLGILTTDRDYYDYWVANASNPTSFNKTLYELINKLSQDASKTPFLYGTGYSDVSDSNETVYALVQCRRDLSSEDCNETISSALQYTQEFGSIRQSFFVYLTTCYLRYSVYPFDVMIPAVMRGSAPPASFPPPPSGSHSASKLKIIIVVVSTCLIFMLILGFAIWFWQRRMTVYKLTTENSSEGNAILRQEHLPRKELHVFDLRTLRAATNNFSKDNMLGEGGFGPVYKGILSNGEEIAVKKLKESSKQGGKEFEAEVRSLASLKHRNLVQLIGYYKDGKEKFLCYEYLPNGSLDNLLFGRNNGALNWEKRYKIAQGISCGLRYVHEESIYKIVHRDLKPANILIDKHMNPKISDFGTAELFMDESTHRVTMNPIWTRGYAAPEYLQHGKFSFKSDVYSFGIILLEIITCQRSIPPNPNATSVIQNVIKHWVDGTIEELMDANWGDAPTEEIKRYIQIGLSCIHDSAAKRPTMGEVDLMLQGYLEVPPVSEEWLMRWIDACDTSVETTDTDSYKTQQYIVQGRS